MYNSAFSPFGPTYLVGTSAVQVKSNNNMYPTGYRFVTLAIPANGVAVFAGIPPNAWFIASAASVEITPGEGIN